MRLSRSSITTQLKPYALAVLGLTLLVCCSVTDTVRLPLRETATAIVCVNLGGALLPILTAVLLGFCAVRACIVASVIMTLTCWLTAIAMVGIGVRVNVELIATLAAISAVALNREQAPIVAFVSGTLGTVIGADLFNLRTLVVGGHELSAFLGFKHCICIGGAGLHDAVLLTGSLAAIGAWGLAAALNTRGTN